MSTILSIHTKPGYLIAGAIQFSKHEFHRGLTSYCTVPLQTSFLTDQPDEDDWRKQKEEEEVAPPQHRISEEVNSLFCIIISWETLTLLDIKCKQKWQYCIHDNRSASPPGCSDTQCHQDSMTEFTIMTIFMKNKNVKSNDSWRF